MNDRSRLRRAAVAVPGSPCRGVQLGGYAIRAPDEIRTARQLGGVGRATNQRTPPRAAPAPPLCPPAAGARLCTGEPTLRADLLAPQPTQMRMAAARRSRLDIPVPIARPAVVVRISVAGVGTLRN